MNPALTSASRNCGKRSRFAALSASTCAWACWMVAPRLRRARWYQLLLCRKVLSCGGNASGTQICVSRKTKEKPVLKTPTTVNGRPLRRSVRPSARHGDYSLQVIAEGDFVVLTDFGSSADSRGLPRASPESWAGGTAQEMLGLPDLADLQCQLPRVEKRPPFVRRYGLLAVVVIGDGTFIRGPSAGPSLWIPVRGQHIRPHSRTAGRTERNALPRNSPVGGRRDRKVEAEVAA